MKINCNYFFAYFLFIGILTTLTGCLDDNSNLTPQFQSKSLTSTANYAEMTFFKGSKSATTGAIYEVLPGPAVINPAMSPTPFSDNIQSTEGAYEIEIDDVVDVDATTSTDAVKSVNITFTANDGKKFKIDQINIIHKPEGTGDHSFFGGVGLNKMMHGDTGIGTALMPKMLAYITLWGLVDLKDAETGNIVASNRIIHIMTASKVRNSNLEMIPEVTMDKSDHDTWMAETHVILIPQDMAGNPSPVPGTDHGFIHMMWENVALTNETRDWKKVYEILPGSAAINEAMSPTPFSNKVAFGAGSYAFNVIDNSEEDSEISEDLAENVEIKYERPNGEMFMINDIQIIHKVNGSGNHTYFGGVGLDKVMHGDTGIGTNLMPKLTSYITLWGITDLKDGNGNIIAPNRLIHIMVSSRSRNDDLKLITSTDVDLTDQSPDNIETHIILPPLDLEGNMSPVPGTGHGFLHLMFENVNLTSN
tara:strand:- start:564 stop:1991 length:1428 start_codon:yes stop_codon:yes gene_type:complete